MEHRKSDAGYLIHRSVVWELGKMQIDYEWRVLSSVFCEYFSRKLGYVYDYFVVLPSQVQRVHFNVGFVDEVCGLSEVDGYSLTSNLSLVM